MNMNKHMNMTEFLYKFTDEKQSGAPRAPGAAQGPDLPADEASGTFEWRSPQKRLREPLDVDPGIEL